MLPKQSSKVYLPRCSQCGSEKVIIKNNNNLILNLGSSELIKAIIPVQPPRVFKFSEAPKLNLNLSDWALSPLLHNCETEKLDCKRQRPHCVQPLTLGDQIVAEIWSLPQSRESCTHSYWTYRKPDLNEHSIPASQLDGPRYRTLKGELCLIERKKVRNF